MKTYKLPDVLGGGVHEEYRHVSGATEAPTGTVAFLVEGHIVCVAAGLLTEVKVLPEEPPANAVVVDRFERAWQATNTGRGGWTCTVDDLGADWEELHADFGPLTLLVPDPFAEPVELPWRRHGVEVGQTFSLTGLTGHVHVSTKGSSHGFEHLKPADAREMARALWAAADRAETSDA